MAFGAAPIAFVFQVQGDAEAKSRIQSVGGAFQNFGKTAQATSQQTQVVTRDFKMAALGMTAAASSAIGLYFQFDNLQKSQLRVEKAEKAVTTAQARLISSQQTLKEMVEKGITTGGDYEAAVLRNKAAQDQLDIATQQLTISQGDNTQAQLQFALQVVPTVITAATSVVGALSAITGANTAVGASAGIGSLGLKGFALAFKSLMLAMGPIGWILLGIGTVLTLIATNAFGVRDAINALGKAIGDALPFLRPILDFLGYVGTALFGETDAMKAEKAPAGMGSPNFEQAGTNLGNNVVSSISSGGGGGGGVGSGGITVKVYVDSKEIASKIKISTSKKG